GRGQAENEARFTSDSIASPKAELVGYIKCLKYNHLQKYVNVIIFASNNGFEILPAHVYSSYYVFSSRHLARRKSETCSSSPRVSSYSCTGCLRRPGTGRQCSLSGQAMAASHHAL